MAKRKNRKWYYVSYYMEYPIYEPAEGGYYYAGNDLEISYRFGSLSKARKFLKKMAAEEEMTMCGNNIARRIGKYIGENAEIRIETIQGKYISGEKTYC